MCMSVEQALLNRRLSSSRHLGPALDSLAYFVKAGHHPQRLMHTIDEALVSMWPYSCLPPCRGWESHWDVGLLHEIL